MENEVMDYLRETIAPIKKEEIMLALIEALRENEILKSENDTLREEYDKLDEDFNEFDVKYGELLNELNKQKQLFIDETNQNISDSIDFINDYNQLQERVKYYESKYEDGSQGNIFDELMPDLQDFDNVELVYCPHCHQIEQIGRASCRQRGWQ